MKKKFLTAGVFKLLTPGQIAFDFLILKMNWISLCITKKLIAYINLYLWNGILHSWFNIWYTFYYDLFFFASSSYFYNHVEITSSCYFYPTFMYTCLENLLKQCFINVLSVLGLRVASDYNFWSLLALKNQQNSLSLENKVNKTSSPHGLCHCCVRDIPLFRIVKCSMKSN